jgi:peroxiredoxin
MKACLSLFIVFLLSTNSFSQFKSVVSGRVDNETKKVYLKYSSPDITHIDSAPVKNNRFVFTKSLPQPAEATLYTDGGKSVFPFFLENGTYVFCITKGSIALEKAPATHKTYLPFTRFSGELSSLFPLYANLSAARDSIGLMELTKRFDSVNMRTTAFAKKMFATAHKTALALFLFQKFASSATDYSQNEPYFKQLPVWARSSAQGKLIGQRIEGAKRTRIGLQAPLFEQRDTAGRLVSLLNFRGKYVLLDFWASWCKPCREENPNLVKAYQQFGGQGFEVLGVSLEYKGAKDRWLKAIQKDGLTWTHVSGLAFFEDPVAVQYAVQSIPQNFLIDPDGKIIAKNLKGETLFQTLREVMQK